MRFALAIIVLGAPGAVDAYSVRRTDGGAALHWTRPPTFWADESLDEITGGAEASRAAVATAVAAWAGVEGAGLESLRAASSTDGFAGYDADHPAENRSQVLSVTSLPGDTPGALAVTVVTYDTATGEIVDADVLVRSRGTQFDLDADRAHHDLPSVLTHEVGHALGLAHETSLEDATMYPETPKGETGQRTLSPDDEAGILEVYGGAVEPPAGPAGCTAVPGRFGHPLFAAFAIAFAALLRRPR